MKKRVIKHSAGLPRRWENNLEIAKEAGGKVTSERANKYFMSGTWKISETDKDSAAAVLALPH